MWLVIPLLIIAVMLMRGIKPAVILGVIVVAMASGGIGYGLGNLISSGWAIYGSILGALVGLLILVGSKAEAR